MQTSDLRHGDTLTLTLQSATGVAFDHPIPPEASLKIFRRDQSNDVFMVIDGEHSVAIEGASSGDQSLLLRVLDSPRTQLAWAELVTPQSGLANQVRVRIHEFRGIHALNDLVIGVNEKSVESIRRHAPSVTTVEEAATWLRTTFLMESDGTTIAMLQSSTAPESDNLHAYRILGTRWGLDLAENDEKKVIVTRLVSVRDPQTSSSKRPPMLFQGSIEFKDHTFATQFRAESALDRIVKKAGSYLGIWQEYNRIEIQGIIRRAKSLGAIHYTRADLLDNGNWRLQLVERSDKPQRPLSELPIHEFDLECVTEPPSFLTREIEEEFPDRREESFREERLPFTGSAVQTGGEYVLIIQPRNMERMEDQPPKAGYITACLRGDFVRINRRRDAWDRISSQTCPMPQLGHLIEGASVGVAARSSIAPLSRAAKGKFGGEPTKRQIEAVNLALNTPDIAVIQGPPGTGKTRVIAAIQARLSELEDAEKRSGNVLLTGYQHTAVENAADAASTLGLPPIKIGRKRGDTTTIDPTEKWTAAQATSIRNKIGTIPNSPLRKKLRDLQQLRATFELMLPTQNRELEVLEQAEQLIPTGIFSILRDRIQDRISELRFDTQPSRPASTDMEATISRILALPESDDDFLEDAGPRDAYRVLNDDSLKNHLDGSTKAVLEKALNWMDGDSLDFLDDLKTLRTELLEKLSSSSDSEASQDAVRSTQTDQILDLMESAFKSRIEMSREGIGDILWDYLDTLDDDYPRVRQALERYTLVLAATCQQAVHPRTLVVKGLQPQDTAIFDTVLVDEAARANPLDLIIPMSLAERRIVLVGDHRQLPHLLEPEVESELSNTSNTDTREALSKSLFERLFSRLKQLEQKDGHPRTITLDQQFRMHPDLGAFISQTFYAEDEQFKSPRPASEFQLDLSCLPQVPAIWVDVPGKKGREDGRRSKFRDCEASRIASLVKEIGSERPDLSIGVITFYRSQVNRIQHHLSREHLGELEDGEFHVSPDWQYTDDLSDKPTERLRVGTVDSFQGMEFDVVLLSPVRSNTLLDKTPADRRRKYGFLMLENRLCVAMSRQKSLLITVGDRAMTQTESAAEAIPGLCAFATLCRSSIGATIDD